MGQKETSVDEDVLKESGPEFFGRTGGQNEGGGAKRPGGGGRPGGASVAAATLFDPWERYIVPEFPFDILPGVLQDYVASQSRVIGVDPSAMAMSSLTAISGALDHRFAVKMMRGGDWWEHPRLWTLLCGDPSTKKTPCVNAATRPAGNS